MVKASITEKPLPSFSPQELTRRILSGPDRETVRRVIDKSIAVSSGKGGVGKTITACNLAISYARKGLRVGLVDLDPLSDVASLLDLVESEHALQGSGADRTAADLGLSAHLLPVFRGLEIMFPFQKLGAAEARGLMEEIYRAHLGEIHDRYDLLLFDMPAGMNYEDNLAYLPFMKRLILVTNPEPTAHASAGAYAKEVQRLYPGMPIHLWHNRYSSRLKEGFHPGDVAGNYNRFVDPADRLTPAERALLRDFAFVPEDPALDLLQGEPNPIIHVLKSMRDGLDYAHGRLLSQAARRLGIPPRIQDLVTTYIHRNPRIGDIEEYLVGLGDYLSDVILAVMRAGRESPLVPAPKPRPRPFTPSERKALESFLRRVKESALRRDFLNLEDLLGERIGRMEDARGAFAGGLPVGPDKAIDREIGRFLVALNRSARGDAFTRKHGALLLFHFSLYKLLQSKTLIRLLKGLIPRKANRQGRKVRDRFRQIRNLVESNAEYRKQYLKILRTLYVIVTRQIAAVSEALGVHELILLSKDSRLNGHAYIRLLAAFLHETIYSGLSVIIGFDYRSAAAAFQRGADALLASLNARGTSRLSG
jgi:flagellar biosynthesis protein FlhG